MSDIIRIKAEEFIDNCIASMSGRVRPSTQKRKEAIDKVEKYTRELLAAMGYR